MFALFPHGHPVAGLADPIYDDLLETLHAAQSPERLVHDFAHYASGFGVISVDYGYVTDAGRRPGWSTNPAVLRDQYFERDWSKLDPEYNPLFRPGEAVGTLMSNAYTEYARENPLVEDLFAALRDSGRRALTFVPDLRPAGIVQMATFNLMTDLPDRSAARWLRKEGRDLSMILSMFHAKMRHMVAAHEAVVLSPRELQVLSAFARGLRAGQIATELGLSERTVEHHTRAARDRLGATTRDQAVARAVAAGWIDP